MLISLLFGGPDDLTLCVINRMSSILGERYVEVLAEMTHKASEQIKEAD